MFKILDVMVIFIHSKTKQKNVFVILGVKTQKHRKSEIAILQSVILRLTCILYAFQFNSLPFMDSQTIATFGSDIACSDGTKT